MKAFLTLLLFCFISTVALAQSKGSSVSKTLQLQPDSSSKSKVGERKRIHLVDDSGSYTGEYMILKYEDEIVREYDYYGASNYSPKGRVKHYANGEILIFDAFGNLLQKEKSVAKKK